MATAMSVKDAARELDVHPQSVYRLIWARQLKASNVGTAKRPRLRVSRAAIERFLREREL